MTLFGYRFINYKKIKDKINGLSIVLDGLFYLLKN